MKRFCGGEVKVYNLKLVPRGKGPPESSLTRLLSWFNELIIRWPLRLRGTRIKSTDSR